MKKAIIIHGYFTYENVMDPNKNTPSNHQWIPWLSKQIYIRDIFPIAIEMPRPWFPNYDDWKHELDRFELDENTILIGHSYGGGFLVRYLSENNVQLNKVILVAPYMCIKPEESLDDKQQDPTFFDFKIDPNLAKKAGELIIFKSTNDNPDIDASIDFLQASIVNTKLITLENRGHFTTATMGTTQFPELLAEILK